MSSRFQPLRMNAAYNSPALLSEKASGGLPGWSPPMERVSADLPRGSQQFWGIPFRLGPTDLTRKGLVVLVEGLDPVRLAVKSAATHVCFLHFCNPSADPREDSAGGQTLAEYVLHYADDEEYCVPIRMRFEVSPFIASYGMSPFAAVPAAMPEKATAETQPQWGALQTGVVSHGRRIATWVYALENPRPEQPIASLELRGVSQQPVAVLGITLYNGPGHPLRHLPRKLYRLLLPAKERTTPGELRAELDMGVITRIMAVPGWTEEEWLEAVERGLGEPPEAPAPGREFLVEATAAEGAVLSVAVPGQPVHEIPLGEAFRKGQAKSSDGKARLEIVNPRTAWVHVTVTDKTTGKPTPTRVHFRGKHGEYLAPYGHHDEINDKWFEDYGGDLMLGRQGFAYVPGSFQIELPVGEVFVELNKGFEYRPVRQRLEIKPGQRELRLTIDRWADWRREGWVTADTHVHFLSPQTAALEGKAEGLNLINLLASQWGRLFTNVADISGEASGCSDEETIVWVGTENRHHLLGHISMLGTRGDPVFPMCAGGPGEAYLGDPDVVALSEWAQTCKEREGVVIRPHFPTPVCEEPVYISGGLLDGAELRFFPNPEEGALDVFQFQEWYRYLNCGYRVAAVGGTDKMSAGMPVGGVRTYAQLDPQDEFTFANWGKAVRAGRTFTTSGPLIEMTVDGHVVGSEIQMPRGGGEVEIRAKATCAWPIHALEVVVNGRVVADSRRPAGANSLSLHQKVKITGSAWIAARCASALQVSHCWPIHLGAHTSPVYVVCGGEELFSPSDATYMLTLLDGGMTYLDTLSVRYSEERHQQIKAIYAQARRHLEERLSQCRGH